MIYFRPLSLQNAFNADDIVTKNYHELSKWDVNTVHTIKYERILFGPLMSDFARFIKQQHDKKHGAKLCFLINGGYKPHEAYQTLYPQDTCGALRISRLTAICSSFHDRKDISRYLSGFLNQGVRSNERVTLENFNIVAKHLMVNAAQTQKIKAGLEDTNYSAEYLKEALLDDKIVHETLARSAAFRSLLIAHLRSELQIIPGDTLMLINMGYSSTENNLLALLLEKALEIKVRYYYTSPLCTRLI